MKELPLLSVKWTSYKKCVQKTSEKNDEKRHSWNIFFQIRDLAWNSRKCRIRSDLK